MNPKVSKGESVLYGPIKKALTEKFRKRGDVHFEVTSERRLSEELKRRLDDTALHMLDVERFVPDIVGYIITGKTQYGETRELAVAEVKATKIRLRDVLQARGYGVVFDANFAILVSPRPLPERIRRFCEKRHNLAVFRGYERVSIGQFDRGTNQFVEEEWYPSPPFKEW